MIIYTKSLNSTNLRILFGWSALTTIGYL